MLFFIILICLAAGTLVSGLLYFRQNEFKTKLRWLLAVLRALAFALLLFVLIAPFINITKKTITAPVVAVLVDNSRSMLLAKDSIFVRQELQKQLAAQLEKLPNAEVLFYSFDENLQQKQADFSGTQTDIANALSNIQKQIPANRLAAIVLATDGIYNLGNNPLYAAENVLLPIHTVAVGDSTAQRDLAVSQVRAPEYVFRGDDITIGITVSAQNTSGANATLTLLGNNKPLQTKQINVLGDNFAQIYNFSVPANQAGIYNFTARLNILPEERNTINNAQNFVVEVIDNRKKIVLLATAPHPDVAAVREALKKVDAYDVDVITGNVGAKIPNEAELVLVFVQPQTNVTQLKATLNAYNGPLWLILDPNTNLQIANTAFEFLSKAGVAQVLKITPNVNGNFGQFKLSEVSEKALKTTNQFSVNTANMALSGTFENLLTSGGGNPLAAYGTVGNRRIVVFNFSGIWQARMQNYVATQSQNGIDEWLQISAQFATQGGVSSRFKLMYEKRQPAGARIAIRAEVYDAALQPSPNAEVNLIAVASDGKRYNFVLSPDGAVYSVAISGLKAGSYNLKATAKMGAETLLTEGVLIVENQFIEDLNLKANHDLLRQMSSTTNGVFVTANDLDALVPAIQANNMMTPIETILKSAIPIIHLVWLFFVALLLFAAEWTLRRYFGRI